jgi:hypothetical protein
MRSYPEDDSDREDLAKLNAEDWQANLLKLNPDYVYWGPYEDYMCSGKKKGRFMRNGFGVTRWEADPPEVVAAAHGNGWREPAFYNAWSEFEFGLNELNECANFYFEVDREGKECEDCGRTGYNPETRQISDDWYDSARTGRKWSNDITQDEVQALVDHRRLTSLTHDSHQDWADAKPPRIPTADEVNAWSSEGGLGHDSINHWICVETRAKRLKVWGTCTTCEGRGWLDTATSAHVNLVLWYLHPRKGASRGVEIKNIQQTDLPKIFKFLRDAAQRNAERFEKVTTL